MILFAQIAVFFFLFILQTSVLRMYASIAPDTALLATAWFALRYGRYGGLDSGVLGGLLQDVASFGMMGINLLSKGVIGLLVGWLKENHLIEWNSVISWIITIGAGTFINGLIFRNYAMSFFDYHPGLLGDIGQMSLQALYNLAVGLPLFSFLIALETKMRRLLNIREA
ncbi:MAG: hypothetical protein EPO63_09010 [Candidatus Nitrosotenuis sp.]|nr:MAG: hypothetical protein EPO63_09010 [Candidatus Nitrosotenuis sp.]